MLPPSLPATLAWSVGLSALGASLLLVGCPPAEEVPCFPTSSGAPAEESEGGFSRRILTWEIDRMPALVDVPDTEAPPSELFLRAQRDMRTEFWSDAAKEFLGVVRGDTNDGKKTREFAEYNLAVCLFRLRYYDDARRIFRLIAADAKHPRRSEAAGWTERVACPG